ncbi:ATP-binding protein [Herminiimonas contaminans]|uniref:ATP-binding protein n=1 Tax=Herminiimonas contaminans TaxID=1111140 RepID=A0ABS0EY57_9BURK|nr:ATP-binding protein [Herminiimonas contaminans]MBF8179769.1 ATP-binding protein [Herminiimonas contaminans]
MTNSLIVPANYNETGVRRFAGNPFIEALPSLENKKDDFLTTLAHYPPKVTDKERKASDVVRLMELPILNDVVHPFPEFQRAGLALTSMMRQTYIARNPLTTMDRQRRHALALGGVGGVPFPSDWKSAAAGHLMMSVSGMGKTTFAKSFLLRYPQVISHVEYNGQPLLCKQVVYIFLRVPHDATLRSLCVQFFEQVDDLLGTTYTRQAISLRQIAPMIELMNRVATAISLGFLVIDEVQNLRYARGGNAEFMLNLFSEIIERLGISLLILATPAVQSVLEGSVRNLRKLASAGETIIRPMGKSDMQWEEFCDVQWDYCFVKNKKPLTKKVRDAWHDSSGGNTAFATLAFMLAQRNEIGGREIIDEAAFARTSAMDMAFLQPAILALRSGKPEQLRAFDDLLFSQKYMALRRLLGANEDEVKINTGSEFEEMDKQPLKKNSSKDNSPRPKRNSKKSSDVAPDLPREDPFQD